jgi:hypothetical protein
MTDKPVIPDNVRGAMPVFYIAAVCFLSSLSAGLAALTLWLMSRGFIMVYGNMQYPARAHIYNSAELAFLAATLGLGHYYIARFFKLFMTEPKGIALAWTVSGAIIALMAFRSAAHTVFSPSALAALPIIAAFLIGGHAGWHSPDDKNPFAKHLRK